MTSLKKRTISTAVITCVVVIAVDQLMKGLTAFYLSDLPTWRAIPVIPNVLYLYHTLNSSGFLGTLIAIPPGFRQLFFILATLVFTGVTIAFLFRTTVETREDIQPLSLLLAGFISNGVDRAVRGAVVDFVVWSLGPTISFNLADLAIGIGFGWLLWTTMKRGFSQKT